LIIGPINISIYWVSLGDRLMVGLQNLDLPIGVRVPVSQFDFGLRILDCGSISGIGN
jgi:hypothetical protein